ncbi:hypothetical protein BHM03_00034257 [Ensete ventricosum]|nr:hypothetical protein BHM03_00034257 [Ensete ventricosum]
MYACVHACPHPPPPIVYSFGPILGQLKGLGRAQVDGRTISLSHHSGAGVHKEMGLRDLYQKRCRGIDTDSHYFGRLQRV